MKAMLLMLALLSLGGCMTTSQAMPEVMESPVYGPLLNWMIYRPLRVEHVEGKGSHLPSKPHSPTEGE